MTKPKALIAGESWTVHSIYQKGFHSFTTTEYAEGAGWLKTALEAAGWKSLTSPRTRPSKTSLRRPRRFVPISGHMTFQDIEAKAQYAGTAVEEALPVTLSRLDDRHLIVAGLKDDWPMPLSYDRVTPKASTMQIVGWLAGGP